MNTTTQREVVVVTGASAGVGRAAARASAEQGAQVGLLARGETGLSAAQKDVEAAGGEALVVPTDVADADQVEAAADAVEDEFGPIDVWMNNAMTSVFSPAKEMEPEDSDREHNLWEPVDDDTDRGAHGAFDERSRSRSCQLRATTHPVQLLSAGFALVTLIGAVVERIRRSDVARGDDSRTNETTSKRDSVLPLFGGRDG